jgi:hypothetical protein
MTITAHPDQQTSSAVEGGGSESTEVVAPTHHKRPKKRSRNRRFGNGAAKMRDRRKATVYAHPFFRNKARDEIIEALVLEDATVNSYQVRECHEYIEEDESTFEICLHYRQGHFHFEPFVDDGNFWKLKVRGVELLVDC